MTDRRGRASPGQAACSRLCPFAPCTSRARSAGGRHAPRGRGCGARPTSWGMTPRGREAHAGCAPPFQASPVLRKVHCTWGHLADVWRTAWSGRPRCWAAGTSAVRSQGRGREGGRHVLAVQVAKGQASELGSGAAVPGHEDLGAGMLQGGLACHQGAEASTGQPVCLLPRCIGLVLAHPPTTGTGVSASVPALPLHAGGSVLGVWADPCLSLVP